MRIWYDACTGKHIRYGTAIARRLRKLGHEVLLTTRKHPDTLNLANILKEEFIPVGEYNPTTLFTRLEESARRILKLSEILRNNIPDIAISHQSVELCRVAFGLGIPIILTVDTPHATAVNKLTIPLASTLVVSEAIPKRLFTRYGKQQIFQFKGVDEVAWIKDFNPIKTHDVKRPIIIVRQMETKASYAIGKRDITEKIARKLTMLGNVIFLSRYDRAEKKGFMTLKDWGDPASLVANADLVVGVGGTIAREAALQGIPSIVISNFGRTYVNRYLSDRGFPLFIVGTSEVLDTAKKYIGKKFDVKEKLAKLENPLDKIEKIISEKLFLKRH
jgi:predicted glycosyltransferase